MPTIAILNPKGGSGKTTISTNLARSLQNRGHSVLLVDSDPQGSARDWHAATEENPLPLISLDRANNFKTLSSISRNYDYTIIDGAAKLEDIIAAAIKVSDIVLIPVQPSPYDLWAASDLVDVIKTRQEITDGKLKAAFITSRAIQGTKLGKEVTEALNDYHLHSFKTVIMQRQVYPQTASDGKSVFEASNNAAKAEVDSLTTELLNYLNTEMREHANEFDSETA